MINSFKVRIILWYTSLVAIIIAGIFLSLYSILGYQLRHEIDTNTIDRVEDISKMLRDLERPPKANRWFLDNIIAGRGVYFYDLRELTDVADDKFVLFAFCSDELMYMSEKYDPKTEPERASLKDKLFNLDLDQGNTETVLLNDISFSISTIQRNGYTVFLGYDLSTVNAFEKRMLQIFLFVAPFGIIFSILCGFYITHRMLTVIKRITLTADQITGKNLSERILEPKGKDEISNLTITLNSMIDRLENAFTVVQQFSHDAAHEIRTPLTVIQGEIEELLNDRKKTGVNVKLAKILEEIQYLSSITNKLLLIHTLDTYEIEYHFEILDLNKIIEEIFSDIQILSAEKNLSITSDLEGSVMINGNDELITRLLWNLVDNAVKYSRTSGEIGINLFVDKGNAIIEVKDNGIGIPSTDLDKIFDRFYRVDKSRSREMGGSGLGLAICKWIVDLHHGTILVESDIDKGSVFRVEIPLMG